MRTTKINQKTKKTERIINSNQVKNMVIKKDDCYCEYTVDLNLFPSNSYFEELLPRYLQIKASNNKAVLTKTEYKDLLTKANDIGLTLLDKALRSNEEEKVIFYFQQLINAVDQEILTQIEYKHLLIKSDQFGSTPVHKALSVG